MKTGVDVEKVHFPQNSRNLGDGKCLGKLRKSFVGHPDAILFLRISRERVFQHPPVPYFRYSESFFKSSGISGNGGNSCEYPLSRFTANSARCVPSWMAILCG